MTENLPSALLLSEMVRGQRQKHSEKKKFHITWNLAFGGAILSLKVNFIERFSICLLTKGCVVFSPKNLEEVGKLT